MIHRVSSGAPAASWIAAAEHEDHCESTRTCCPKGRPRQGAFCQNIIQRSNRQHERVWTHNDAGAAYWLFDAILFSFFAGASRRYLAYCLAAWLPRGVGRGWRAAGRLSPASLAAAGGGRRCRRALERLDSALPQAGGWLCLRGGKLSRAVLRRPVPGQWPARRPKLARSLFLLCCFPPLVRSLWCNLPWALARRCAKRRRRPRRRQLFPSESGYFSCNK